MTARDAAPGRIAEAGPDALTDVAAFADHLTSGGRAAARGVVAALRRGGGSYVDVGVGVIQPSMYEVGDRWQRRRISVAQEHLATAISHGLLMETLADADFAPENGRKALFACVASNHHALGLRMVSDAFTIRGWTVQYLGADVPTGALVEQVDRFRPELVGLSIALPRHVATARHAIERIRAGMGAAAPTVLIGGLASNRAERPWATVGADVWRPDARAIAAEHG